MMNFLRKFQIHILITLLVFFLLSIILGFGSSFFVKGAPNDTLVEVDGEDIPLKRFTSLYSRAIDQLPAGARMDENARKQKQQEVIRDLVQSVVFQKQIERYGIRVPDNQVAMSLAQVPGFQTNGRFDPSRYAQVIYTQLKISPREFEDEQRVSIGFFKLRWLLTSTIKVTDGEMQQHGPARYAEFAKAHVSEGEGAKKRTRTAVEIRELYRQALWEEKSMWILNQWFNQLGQKLQVKVHDKVLEAGAR